MGLEINAGAGKLTSKLFIDAMGLFSPLAAQARAGVKPRGNLPGSGELCDGIRAK